MRAHRVGGVEYWRCSFCTTSHPLSLPPHRPSPRHGHLPLSPLSHGDFRPAAKWKFLYDQAIIVREGRMLYAGGCTTSRRHRIVAELKLIQAGFLPWQMCPNKGSKSVFATAYEEESLNDGYVTTSTGRPHALRAASLDEEGFECT